ncbi:N,N-dimethylformamidase beta subunit family domain-containing protein [Candidatus Poriferisodalis sp.]|uniref:N,N-dimethylformamidase beta subunit family domain-containing protein n=1 Tax=Candidatus Poriferisodalis sp. TaxID=3101277 RepID=UPI003B59926D
MIAGYCWPHSGVAGDTIDLMISAVGGSCGVEVLRIGADETSVAFWEVPVTEQPVPDDCATEGCGWAPSLSLEIDPAWQPGFHLVRLHGPDGEIAEAFFVVRAAEPGETLLVLSTSTWAAYNDWGGPSFYTGGHESSQQRPLPRGFLDKPDPHRYRVARFGQLPRAEVADYFDNYSFWSTAAGWANWERLFVSWAERNGVSLDYATSLDLHTQPDLLVGRRLYLSVGHDEYWSAEMRNHVENWVETGGAVAFFSGNTSFWQVRFGDDDRVIGYKLDFHLDPVMGTDAEHTVSTMWSDPLTGRPESEMTGVSFTRGGYAHCRRAPKGSGGYTIWRPEHWAFDGLRLIAGDVVGAEPVVVGYECDGCEMALVDGLPVSTGTGGTPANFEVLGTAPAHLWETSEAPPGLPESYVGELNWVTERLGGGDTPENRERFAYGAAVMGWFRRGHGEVFTTGCTDWAYGLEHDDVATVTRNVIGRYVDLAGGKPGSP